MKRLVYCFRRQLRPAIQPRPQCAVSFVVAVDTEIAESIHRADSRATSEYCSSLPTDATDSVFDQYRDCSATGIEKGITQSDYKHGRVCGSSGSLLWRRGSQLRNWRNGPDCRRSGRMDSRGCDWHCERVDIGTGSDIKSGHPCTIPDFYLGANAQRFMRNPKRQSLKVRKDDA